MKNTDKLHILKFVFFIFMFFTIRFSLENSKIHSRSEKFSASTNSKSSYYQVENLQPSVANFSLEKGRQF